MDRRWLAVMFVGAALFAGCSDDSKATDAGTDAGGEGGKGGKGGNGGGGSGGMPAETIMCGSTQCAPPEITLPDGGFELPGVGPITPELITMFGAGPENCCAGKDKDVCGVTQSMLIMDGSCLERDQPGRAAGLEECPGGAAKIMGVSLPLDPCCRPDNTCGVQLDLFGVGCLENSVFMSLQSMGASQADAGVDASVPDIQPKACAYEPTADDAGADDAGR